MIQVRALGACEVQIGRRRITLTTEVPFALAFYLAQRAGERVTRDELAETFWGGEDMARSRHSLRQTLYKLRAKGFPFDDGAEELLLTREEVDSDLTRVLASDWADQASPEAVEAAGNVLPGFSRRMASGFMEWLDAMRDRVAAAHRRACLVQIGRARREGRWPDVDRWARAALEGDPLNEEATLARAECAAMSGSKATALEILDAYLAELGDRTAAIGLPASVLRRRIAERQVDWNSRGLREIPLLGRSQLMGSLCDQIDAATHGKSVSALFSGAPGVGKTRLALEAIAFAELRGFTSLALRADPSHAARPFATLLDLLPRVLELPGAAGAAPGSLAFLRRMIRRTEGDDLLAPVVPGTETRAWAKAAVIDLVRSVSEETRAIVLIDDLHHADDASVEVLRSLVAATTNTRWMWLLTTRRRDDRWESSDSAATRHIVVPSLSDDASLALAQAYLDNAPQRRNATEIASIARASGGNPLFIRELTCRPQFDRTELPLSLQQLMQRRIAALAAPELELLRVTTLLGPLSSVSRLCSLLGQPPSTLASTIDSLESEGILRVGPSQTLELHECWHSAVSESIGSGLRAALALHCGSMLERELDEDFPGDVQLAWHAGDLLEIAGERVRSRRLFLRCGEQMIRMGVAGDTVPVLDRAHSLSRTPDEQVEVMMHLMRSHHFADRLADCVDLARSARALRVAPSPKASQALTIIQALLVGSRIRMRQDHRSELHELARLAQDRAVPPSARLYACLFGIRAVFSDAHSPLESVFRDAARDAGSLSGESLVGALVELIWLAERADSDAILRHAQQIATLNDQDEPVALRAMALRFRALAHRWSGDLGSAETLAGRAHDIASQAGIPYEICASAELLSFMALDRADLPAATKWIDTWRDSEIPGAGSQRLHAFRNALARLHLQSAAPELALGELRPHLTAIHRDPLAKQRASDYSIIACAAASTGDRALADEVLPFARSIIESEPPAAFLDYPAEMVARTLRALNRVAEARAFSTGYLVRRGARMSAGLPNSCTELRELTAGSVTGSADVPVPSARAQT